MRYIYPFMSCEQAYKVAELSNFDLSIYDSLGVPLTVLTDNRTGCDYVYINLEEIKKGRKVYSVNNILTQTLINYMFLTVKHSSDFKNSDYGRKIEMLSSELDYVPIYLAPSGINKSLEIISSSGVGSYEEFNIARRLTNKLKMKNVIYLEQEKRPFKKRIKSKQYGGRDIFLTRTDVRNLGYNPDSITERCELLKELIS